MVVWLSGYSVGWLVCCLADLLGDNLFSRLAGWLDDQKVNC